MKVKTKPAAPVASQKRSPEEKKTDIKPLDRGEPYLGLRRRVFYVEKETADL